MNFNKIVTIFLCVLLFVSVLFQLSGCTEKLPDMTPTYSYTPRLKGSASFRATTWDNYILTNHSAAIYDRTTGEVFFRLCQDVECDGNCPVEKGGVTFTGISKERLYFSVFAKDVYYGYYDILTSEITYLLDISKDERLPVQPMFVDGGYVYISRKHLKEGGDPKNAADYIAHLSRLPEDGGKEEVIYAMRGNAETLLLINDGVMYSYFESKLWKTDLETWKLVVLHDLSTSEIDGVGEFSYLDGQLYFNMIKNSDHKKYIIRMDAQTGEWSYLVDIPVTGYFITNEAVYFEPEVERRLLSDPTRYPLGHEDAKTTNVSATLYACDLDGGNVRAVYTDELLAYQYCTIVDNVLYGWICYFDQDRNAWGDIYFAELHFDTGEIIPATVVD